ncbi:MAG: type II secretion system F family protein [Kiritimatiellia bacterium]
MNHSIDFWLGVGGIAVASAFLAFVLVKTFFRTKAIQTQEHDRGERSILNELLTFVAGWVIRRRGMDTSLERRLTELETLVRQSGGQFLMGATGAEIFVARWVFPFFATSVLGILLSLLHFPGGVAFLIILVVDVMLWFWPESALRDGVNIRARLFVRQLPGALDIMRLMCQSGGDLNSGLTVVTDVYEPGPVREELILVRNEVAFGTSLQASLGHLSERIHAPEATAVFTTLAQSLEMGTSISENLRSASELIRRQSRVRAQEKAQKAVVSMSFPLLLLILPGVFIVLLGPLVIQFVTR